jgi:hypothetical protein
VRRWLPAALVALLAAAVFAHTLPFDFVYDDVPVILRNEHLHSLAAWREILAGPWWSSGLYRPLTSLTFAINWAMGGGSPWPFHLTNVLAHAAASVLVLLLAKRLLPPAAALAAALLFAVHPVHVEAVANLVGRAEVLATLFTVAAALLYLEWGERPTPLRGAGVLLLVLLGLGSKESAFAAPALLLVVDWAAARRGGEAFGERFRRHQGLWLGTAAVAAGWLGLRTAVLGDVAGDYPAPGLAGTSMADRIAIMLPVVPHYLRLLFLPARLSVDYSPNYLPVSTAISAAGLVGAILLLGAVAAGAAARVRRPAVTAGLLWIGASLAIVGNIVLPSGVVLAERLLYLASVGACLVAGAAWSWLYDRRRALAIGALAVVLAAGAVRSWTRARVWRDNTTLFHQIGRDAPGSFRADWVAGMLAYRAGDADAGDRLMARGFSIYPGQASMWIDFARELERRRRWPEAANAFWRAFTLEPTLVGEAARAIADHLRAGELDSATSRLAQARRRLPQATELTIAASHVALARGDLEGALTLRRQVAREHPEDWRYWLLTAEAALRARRCADLTESVGRLRTLEPRLPRLATLTDSARALGCEAPTPPR